MNAPKNPRTFQVKSFGCQMNVYDGARMSELLEAEGMSAAESAEDADLRLGSRVHVKLGYEDRTRSMMRGYISTLTPEFADGPPTLTVPSLMASGGANTTFASDFLSLSWS